MFQKPQLRPAARPRARQGEAGYLLLEITISLTVLLMSMIVLYTTILSGHVQSAVNKEKHRALQDVRALMEQINVVPASSLGQVFPHDAAIPEFNDLHVRDQRVRVRYENGDATARPLHYEVLASWTTGLGQPTSLFVRGIRAR